ncbi:hypothetical protein [Coleofasciculus sp. E1-EBD-02]|uniref:hypothetical protein n=1 Tax=Coleofasciculus sp. E1-EBD-02 TaxID=3068481 RepID=UPI004062A652
MIIHGIEKEFGTVGAGFTDNFQEETSNLTKPALTNPLVPELCFFNAPGSRGR